MNMTTQQPSQQYDITQLINIIWQGKWILVSAFVLSSALSVWLALALPNVYKAEALLSSTENNASSMGRLAGNLGGLAGLAGINLSGSDGGDKTQLAIEVLRSREFFANFDAQHNITPLLLGIEGWDRDNNAIQYDPELYDFNTQKWVRVPTPPRKVIPSVQEGHAAFIELLNVEHDKQSGFTTLSMEHMSPHVAKETVDRLINMINETIRQKDIAKAERSIEYLKKEIASSEVTELQGGLFDLIQIQIEKIMLANANPEYVFQVIDPAVVPELKAKPKRALICVVGAFLGTLIGLIIVLLRNLKGNN